MSQDELLLPEFDMSDQGSIGDEIRVSGFAKALVVDRAKHETRVNALVPSFVERDIDPASVVPVAKLAAPAVSSTDRHEL